MNNFELGISFRSEAKTLPVVRETATRYGLQTDFLGIYDDLGDIPPILPLYEAACNLPKDAFTRLGAVGFAIPKHPTMVDIAGYMSTLNNVIQNPGRIITGLVPGAWMDTIGLMNASVGRTKEAIQSLKYLLGKKNEGFNGKHYQIKPGFILNYETPKGVPILLGAWGPQMAALAGEIADEIKIGGSANPAMISIMRQRLQVGIDKTGRKNNVVKIALGAVSIIHQDRKVALQVAKRKAVLYVNVIGHKDPTAIADFPDEIAAIKAAMSLGDIDTAVNNLPDELAERFVIAGTPEDITKHTRKILEAGADRVEFGGPHGIGETAEDEINGVKLLVEQVFPYFR